MTELMDRSETSIAVLATACFRWGLEDGRANAKRRTPTGIMRSIASDASLPLVERWRAFDKKAMQEVYNAAFEMGAWHRKFRLGEAFKR